MKKFWWYFFVLIFFMNPRLGYADVEGVINIKKNNNGTAEVSMTALDAVKLAGNMVERGNFDTAEQILTKMPPIKSLPIEIERWFLLGQIAARRGDYDTAIKIFRKILDAQPDLARIRFELALCYMQTGKWARADYHLRLAMAGDGLSDNVKRMMNYYRYVVRQNKNWDVWFNFGVAPDNNVNNAGGGKECVYGTFCHDLTEPETAIGYNLQLGGNYEFKLSEHWRWKSDVGIYTNIYNLHDYDDLYLYGGTGPRYIWNRGDVWLAPVVSRRWYGWEKYDLAYGLKLDANYDFTRKLSAGIYLRVMDNNYDKYGEYLNAKTYSANTRLTYSLSSNMYYSLRGGVSFNDAIDEQYSYYQPIVAVGIGAELPFGFHVYMEPAVYWTKYRDERWVVANERFTQKTERDFIQRYTLSVSNNKMDIWGFVPTVVFGYTKRDSNIWQREYDKWSAEFTLQQRF
ncbi:MAG: surface lipoprotein assembly modifier [Alphaproteobacteria bacterium]|nr:surface lipoprotein assembly modifier [Alphaproteobacteria bacterium]